MGLYKRGKVDGNIPSGKTDQKTDRVFYGIACTPIDDHNLKRAFRRALIAARIENLHFHDLRHIFDMLTIIPRVSGMALRSSKKEKKVITIFSHSVKKAEGEIV